MRIRDARRALVVVLAVLAGSCAPKDRKEKWLFAIEETRGSVQDAYARRFEELVEARSGGAIDVIVYPYGTLGTSDMLTEQLHMGTIQFAMASPGHLGKLIPEVQVLLLHFVLSDDDEVNRRVLASPELRAEFDALYARKGLKLLSFFSEGWQVWTTNKEVRRPADFKGVKFRVMTSPLLLAAYEAYGASATPLPYAEVYSALQLNMIEGQVNPVFAIEEMSFYEVTDWMIFANHAPFVTSAVTNREFYEGLSDERRRMLDGVVAELGDYIFDVQRRFNDERLAEIRRKRPQIRIVHLTAEERAAFREASRPVRERFVELAGPGGAAILEKLRAIVEREEARR